MDCFGKGAHNRANSHEMRKVQFSDDVRTVEYAVSKSKKNHKWASNVRPKEDFERGKNGANIEECDGEMSYGEQESATSARRRDRRQSLAAQIFMAPTKWGQQKDYRQRKMSLHGKPIYYTPPSRRKHEVRKLMIAVFNFLERPEARSFSAVYHVFTFLLVCTSLVVTVFATIPEHKIESQRILFILEIIFVIVFSLELFARVWSAGCRMRYQGFKGRLRFLRKPFCIIDMITIISSLIIIIAGNEESSSFAATAMRGLRFLQVLRMIRVDRRGGTWKLLGSVVSAHSKELITAWYIGFLALIFASFLVYQVEKEENPEDFGTFADALWWGLITLTTIGYGDKTPHSWAGRLIASCFAILGISFFALPAGILGSGFALKVQEQHRQKHFARRRTPAAFLIQCFWRCYAADADSTSSATWQPHFRGYVIANNSQGKKSLKERFMGTYGTKVRVRGRMENEATSPTTLENSKDDFVKSTFGRLQRFGSTNRKYVEKKEALDLDLENSDDDSSTKSSETFTEFTEVQKNAIRGIRMLKFQVARRKFKEALRPYDVKDVIEQYSSGHVDMLARVKNLQSRVDSIVGIRSTAASPSVEFARASSIYRAQRGTSINGNKGLLSPFEKDLSMNERLINVESSVAAIERKIDILINSFERHAKVGEDHQSKKPDHDSTSTEESEIVGNNEKNNDENTHQSTEMPKTKFVGFGKNLTSPRLGRRRDIAYSNSKFFSMDSCKDLLYFSNDRDHCQGGDQNNVPKERRESEDDNYIGPSTPFLDSSEDCSDSIQLQSISGSSEIHESEDLPARTTHFTGINRTVETALC